MPYNLEEYSVDRYLCFDPNRIDPETKQPSPYYTAIGDRGVFMNRTFYPMSAIKQMEYAWYYQTNSRSGYSLVKGRGESDSDFYKRCREKGIGTCGTGLCASAVNVTDVVDPVQVCGDFPFAERVPVVVEKLACLSAVHVITIFVIVELELIVRVPFLYSRISESDE